MLQSCKYQYINCRFSFGETISLSKSNTFEIALNRIVFTAKERSRRKRNQFYFHLLRVNFSILFAICFVFIFVLFFFCVLIFVCLMSSFYVQTHLKIDHFTHHHHRLCFIPVLVVSHTFFFQITNIFSTALTPTHVLTYCLFYVCMQFFPFVLLLRFLLNRF